MTSFRQPAVAHGIRRKVGMWGERSPARKGTSERLLSLVTPLERDKPSELVLCREWNKVLWESRKAILGLFVCMFAWGFLNYYFLWDFFEVSLQRSGCPGRSSRGGAGDAVVEQKPWYNEVCGDQPLAGLLCSACQEKLSNGAWGFWAICIKMIWQFLLKWDGMNWFPPQVFESCPWCWQLKHRTISLRTFTIFQMVSLI